MKVSVEEAQTNLREFAKEAASGAEKLIEAEENITVKLVTALQEKTFNERPGYGSAKGWFTLSDDFDEPLEDLEKALKGEEVLISHEGIPLKLVLAEIAEPSKRRLFGSAKGWFGEISDDFDAPLEELVRPR